VSERVDRPEIKVICATVLVIGMYLLPCEFFVTSASAFSEVSDLNAFDMALISMGIGEQNLVAVSSVIPAGAVEVDVKDMPRGAVTHCVLAQIRGSDGDIISAGIAYAFRKDGNGGYVAEGRIHGSESSLKDALKRKMNEMARCRNVELSDVRYVTEELSVPKGHYGACLAALVFTRYE